MGTSNQIWMMKDIDNSDPRTGKNYVWLFRARQEARDHRASQHALRNGARLTSPKKLIVYNFELFTMSFGDYIY